MKLFQMNEQEDFQTRLEMFVSKVSKNIYLDSSRTNLSKQVFNTLCNLTNGTLKGHAGCHRLILGRKGVGKTTFLEELQRVAKDYFQDLITIYHEYLSTTKSTLPSALISQTLDADTNDIKTCEKLLEEKRKFVFIVLDEIQNLYLQNENGKSIIDELSEIGGSRMGRFFCIITGSSYHLRQLCFAKLPNDKKNEFPNYISLDLNSTKYSSRWIYPFLDAKDFEELVKFIQVSSKIDLKNMIAELYLKSGGNPRLLKDLILNNQSESYFDSYSISMRHFRNATNNLHIKILETIYECTSAYVERNCISTVEDLSVSIYAFEAWTKLLRYRVLSDKLYQNGIEENELLPLLYDLADSGHIRFIDNQVSGWDIGLGSPIIYLQLANKGKKEISLDEAFALKNPTGVIYSEIAENVVLRILAKNSHIFQIPDLMIQDTNVEKLILKKDYTRQREDASNACDDLNDITNRLFKENYVSISNEKQKDTYGIAGILLTKTKPNDTTLIAHRIQIKLGSRVIRLDEAEKIINKVNSNLDNFNECFLAANKIIQQCINYLVTTRSIDPDAKIKFQESNWKVLGKTELSKIWPDDVKALGSPYK